MVTEAQILANRRNAQKSTGPRTPEGKAIVSQNAVKHGLLARCDVIGSESQADFDLYRQKLVEELAPASPMESILAERIVSLSWRLKRIGRIQNQTIDALSAPKPPGPLSILTKSLFLKGNLSAVGGSSTRDTLHASRDATSAAGGTNLALGRLAIDDFSNARVLDRLLMYERRLEHSLYRTLLEFQRLHLIKKLDSESKIPFNQLTI